MTINFNEQHVIEVVTAMTVLKYQEGSLDSVDNRDIQNFLIEEMLIDRNKVITTGEISDIRQALETGVIVLGLHEIVDLQVLLFQGNADQVQFVD